MRHSLIIDTHLKMTEKTSIPNNDFRDWILWNVDNETYIYDETQFKEDIKKFDKLQKIRYNIAIEELLMNGSFYKVPKESKYILTSLGREVLKIGSFQSYSPKISSDLNINKKFSKSQKISTRATNISVGVGIGTLIVLIVQIYINVTLPTYIEGKVIIKSSDSLEQELQIIRTKLESQNSIIHTLKDEYHKQTMILD